MAVCDETDSIESTVGVKFQICDVTKIDSWQLQLNNIPVDEIQDLLKRSKSANTKIFLKNLEKEIRREF